MSLFLKVYLIVIVQLMTCNDGLNCRPVQGDTVKIWGTVARTQTRGQDIMQSLNSYDAP